MIKYIIMMAVLLFLGILYSGFRLLSRTSLSKTNKIFLWFFLFIPLSNIPLRMYVRSNSIENLTPPWVDTALFFSYLSMGALSILVTVLVVYDIFLLVKGFIGKIKKAKYLKGNCSEKSQVLTPLLVNKERRVFMQNAISGSLASVAAGFVFFGSNEALALPQIKKVTVPLRNLPKSFHGFKIVQVTDLHINKPFAKQRLEKIVDAILELKADTIVVTGDLSDSHVKHVYDEISPLARLKAHEGVYFVSGNHEYYTNIDQWLALVKQLGLINLHNEHKVIERDGRRLLMCGVPDIYAPRLSSHVSDPILAQSGSRAEDIKILLAHQPQSIYEAVKVNYHLQISGHTHGGQFFPWTYVTDLVQPYIHGLYEVENTQLYVSRGTGYWGPPIRIGAPAEITLLELVPSKLS